MGILHVKTYVQFFECQSDWLGNVHMGYHEPPTKPYAKSSVMIPLLTHPEVTDPRQI
jgi:hypothetical protein